MISDIILAIYLAVHTFFAPVSVVISYLFVVPEYPLLGWVGVVVFLIVSFQILPVLFKGPGLLKKGKT